jgi:hypothetical protein
VGKLSPFFRLPTWHCRCPDTASGWLGLLPVTCSSPWRLLHSQCLWGKRTALVQFNLTHQILSSIVKVKGARTRGTIVKDPDVAVHHPHSGSGAPLTTNISSRSHQMHSGQLWSAGMSQPLAPRPSNGGGSSLVLSSTQRRRKISTACEACKQRKTKVS